MIIVPCLFNYHAMSDPIIVSCVIRLQYIVLYDYHAHQFPGRLTLKSTKEIRTV